MTDTPPPEPPLDDAEERAADDEPSLAEVAIGPTEPTPMPTWVPRAILTFFAGFAGLFVLYWVFQKLSGLLVMLLVSLFLSFALEPAVNWMERHGVRRGLGTALTFLAVLVSLGVFFFFMGRLLVDQISDLVDRAPDYIRQIEEWANERFDAEIDTDQLVEEFQSGGRAEEWASSLAGNIYEIGTQVVTSLFQLLTVGLFTFYLVADGPRLRRTILSTLTPVRQREVLRVWEIAIQKTGGYIYSRGLLAFASALVHWAAFALLEVPSALPLALWVGVISQLIPTIGTYLAGALPLLIATLDEPISGLWVLAVVVVYQQIENYVLLPRVSAHTMELHAAVAFGAVIAGAAMLGATGALLALPAAATLQAFVSTYLQRHEVVSSSLTDSQEHGPGLRDRWRARHPDA